MKHIRQDQHWTRCQARIRLLPDAWREALVPEDEVARMPRAERDRLCAACVDRWRNDPQRAR